MHSTTKGVPQGAPTETAAVRYGTEREAAALLGLSAVTLRTWRCRRQGPPCWKRFGKSVRYDLAALRAWAAAQPGAEARDDTARGTAPEALLATTRPAA